MTKYEYFIKALNAGLDKKRWWVLSAFSAVERELFDPEKHLKQEPYKLYKDFEGMLLFLDENENLHSIAEVSGSDDPLYSFLESVDLKPGDIPNHTEDKSTISTTYGNILVNHLLLCYPFGNTYPFITGQVNIKDIEKYILDNLIDDPEDDSLPFMAPDGKIYVRQYLMFAEYAQSIVAYTELCVQSVTPKSLQGHPKARETRDRLLEENKDRLNDPVVVAKITEELVNLDREWLEDDPSMKFYGAKDAKYFGKVRPKTFYIGGAESAFSDGSEVTLIAKSLEEGIDTDNYPALINSLRYGSYNRGHQTQLGGETAKTIYRMMGNASIVEDDCGVKFGIRFTLYPEYASRYVGFNQIVNGKLEITTPESLQAYYGKEIEIRSPFHCQTQGRNVCKACMGPVLSEQPNGLASASANTGGVFLSLFLASMHGTVHKTQEWKPELVLR